MAISTPRGFIIRLPKIYVFALLARLSKFEDPFGVLQRIEAIHHIRGMLVYSAAVATALLASKATVIPAVMVFASIFATEIQFMKDHPHFLVSAGHFWSRISGFMLLSAVAGGIVWVKFGWVGLSWFAAGRVFSEIAFYLFDLYFAFRMQRRLGIRFLSIERYFLLTYQSLARKHGISPSTLIAPGEIESGLWINCLERFKAEWPTVERRFFEPTPGGRENIQTSMIVSHGIPDNFGD